MEDQNDIGMEAGKPRMHWILRLLIYFGVFFVVSAFGELFLPGLIRGVLRNVSEDLLNPIIDFVINVLAGLAVILAFCKIERTNAAGIGLIGLDKGGKHLGAGLLVGAVLIALVVGILVLKGDVRIEKGSFSLFTLAQLLNFISVGFVEEVLTRGAMQHVLTRSGKPVLGILIPSVLFGLMHLLNPSVNVLAIVNTILVGLLLGLVTYLTENLYWAIGFHITWNFFLSVVFGLTVSGLNIEKGRILESVLLRKDLWNGGDYGIEAGLIVTILFVGLSTYLVYRIKMKQGKEVTVGS